MHPFDKYKTIIIHCGLHKTGTSSIQSAFAENPDVLKRHSIDFPRVLPLTREWDGNHSILFIQDGESDRLLSTLSQRLEFDTSNETLLISAEELSNVSRLRNILSLLKVAAPAADLRVIVYLRRYDHLLESVYSESVKRNLAGAIEGASYDLHFERLLRSIVEQVGAEKMVVRPYNRALWRAGDLGIDFCYALGHEDLWDAFSSETKQLRNISLSRAHTFLLSLFADRRSKAKLLDYYAIEPLKVPPDVSKFFSTPSRRREFESKSFFGSTAGVRRAETWKCRAISGFGCLRRY